jgi:hypothetical protein
MPITTLLGHNIFAVGALAFWLAPHVVLAKPGAESLVKTRTVTARLYISAVGYSAADLTGVELVWVPESVEAACKDRSLKECESLDYERRVIRSAGAENVPIGLKPPTGEIPSRVLKSWVTIRDPWPESKDVLETLRNILSRPPELKNKIGSLEYRYPTLQADRSVKGQLKWELWSNGENFRIQKVRTR